MTKQEQNDIILRHIDDDLRESPGVQERVGNAFNKWFQQLIQLGSQNNTEKSEEAVND